MLYNFYLTQFSISTIIKKKIGRRPYTLKSAVFGSSTSLPPLVSEGGGLVCESVGKADLLSDHFDS